MERKKNTKGPIIVRLNNLIFVIDLSEKMFQS